jgi:hypothetical protein
VVSLLPSTRQLSELHGIGRSTAPVPRFCGQYCGHYWETYYRERRNELRLTAFHEPTLFGAFLCTLDQDSFDEDSVLAVEKGAGSLPELGKMTIARKIL